jgi:hypothetical protein
LGTRAFVGEALSTILGAAQRLEPVDTARPKPAAERPSLYEHLEVANINDEDD